MWWRLSWYTLRTMHHKRMSLTVLAETCSCGRKANAAKLASIETGNTASKHRAFCSTSWPTVTGESCVRVCSDGDCQVGRNLVKRASARLVD
ncbi:hypothetical protein P153DRAFT_158438 [Dothidotthia symphoricarpi CBS 119687]|uniref:Uncharacterized protein n=1 Tax=Dothidotthia symphoricarpi CBS 119687 TaxID=1392245 RepID=A0A6A6ASL3_9PLEO|nr:uncharacterized protein P153DRAFT_158438 [Dothidotthia symphoricarpi CBS 119687]KAF2133531.1 hypothetical protein P153DRAFT_158438 [Dothidotthia symphoricarpi CBS 119687]